MLKLPGKFVWFEHFSADPSAAKNFYQSLFGWQVMPIPLGLQFYHLAMLGGSGIGGFRTSPMGAPPGWLGYLSAWPPMSWLFEIAYRLFLPIRPRLQQWVRRWSGEDRS